ncbi:MAG: hypothetical protein A2498_08130 [Lentisphaerae bacterium RIFOXYC12_FULL_60_16]|nr:MAG: hypothetical protein A2498_08130 [Lentisphaerae bacterium RIFOXYC12_FULL_60_16]OGV79725.1 MAG: hypothetical protein A2340_14700 [Lentisphaerae bacterium RIFOXYB12_FULL_60_10]
MTDTERLEKVDGPFYRNEVAPILPPKVLDFHTHTWSAQNWKVKPWESGKDGGTYMVTDEEYPPERLASDGRRAFPDRPYEAVIFGYPSPVADWEKDTAFVAAAGQHRGFYPLVLGGQELALPPGRLRRALDATPFLGFKVFLNWIGDAYGDKTIEQMLGPEEMTLANERRLVVLLHVPRSGRLADPVIQAGVVKLAKDYPGAQIVLAHCGRCYLPSEMRRAIGALRDVPNVHLDTSMVMDALVLQMVMDEIGSDRLVFATDFPVAAMRGRRVRVMDHWVDVVLDGYPPSAYRLASDGIRATFMAVEIAVAIRDAAERVGLTDARRRAIFYDNGIRLLEAVDQGRAIQRLRGEWR